MAWLTDRLLKRAEQRIRRMLEDGEEIVCFDVAHQIGDGMQVMILGSDRAIYLVWKNDHIQAIPMAMISAIGQPSDRLMALAFIGTEEVALDFGRSPRGIADQLLARLIALHRFRRSVRLRDFEITFDFHPWRPDAPAWWRWTATHPGPLLVEPTEAEWAAAIADMARQASRVPFSTPTSPDADVIPVPPELDEDGLGLAWYYRLEATEPPTVVRGDLLNSEGDACRCLLILNADELHLVHTTSWGLPRTSTLTLNRALDLQALRYRPGDPGRVVRLSYGPPDADRHAGPVQAAQDAQAKLVGLGVPASIRGDEFIASLRASVETLGAFPGHMGEVFRSSAQ